MYPYAFIYGVIAVGVTIFWTALSPATNNQAQGADFSNLWIRAVAVGLTVARRASRSGIREKHAAYRGATASRPTFSSPVEKMLEEALPR